MSVPTPRRQPHIAAIINQNPEWSQYEQLTADEVWHLLLEALASESYTFRAFKYFDSLACLDDLDPREWLVWNFGEEWAGRPWSDAAVVEEIERRGFAYTGATPAQIHHTQSRIRVKETLLAAGRPTLPYDVFAHSSEAGRWATYPALVKAVHQHGSCGIDREAVVLGPEELALRIEHIRAHFHDDAIVEPFVDTREFQVAVWGNHSPEVLPPSEIVFSAFADFRDRVHTLQWKIERHSRGYQEIMMPCPAPLDRPDWRARVEEVGLRAYQAFGLRDYARFDLRMLGDEPQVLDVNCNPELDPQSVVLAGARAIGLTYGGMIRRIIEFASARMPA